MYFVDAIAPRFPIRLSMYSRVLGDTKGEPSTPTRRIDLGSSSPQREPSSAEMVGLRYCQPRVSELHLYLTTAGRHGTLATGPLLDPISNGDEIAVCRFRSQLERKDIR